MSIRAAAFLTLLGLFSSCTQKFPSSQPGFEALILYNLLLTGGSSTSGSPQIAAGQFHTCALLRTRMVRCWGYGADGQLGYNSTSNVGDGAGQSIIAAGDVPLGGTALQVTAGDAHTCALLSTGAVRCWGSGASGQLGYNSSANVGNGSGLSIIAAGDVPLGGTAVQIAAGGSHTCAVLTSGALRCWGAGAAGRLGYNATANVGDGVGLSIAASGDVPVGGTVASVSAGATHTCAVLTTGALRCWGNGSTGQLGYNSAANVGDGIGLSITAVANVPVGTTVSQVATGSNHTCVITTSGGVRCSGQGTSGRLGYNSNANVGNGVGLSIIASGDVLTGAAASRISAGSHTCAQFTGGTVRCWGSGTGGRLGYNATANVGDGVGLSIAASGDVPVGGTVASISAGATHACALLTTDAVRCWGNGTVGKLGYNATANVGDGLGLSIVARGDVPLQ